MTKLKRLKISGAELDKLFDNVDVICRNRHDFIKVAIDRPSQTIIKSFDLSRKNFFRRHVISAARNFIKNAKKLKDKGVKTIQPLSWYWCPERGYEVISYVSLPGKTLYDLAKNKINTNVFPLLAAYVAELHAKRIYFRAGHPGNYLLQEGNQFALIDIDNTRFSLSLRRRAKNLAFLYEHSTCNAEGCFSAYSPSKFVQDYFSAAKLNPRVEKIVLRWLKHYLTKQHINFS